MKTFFFPTALNYLGWFLFVCFGHFLLRCLFLHWNLQPFSTESGDQSPSNEGNWGFSCSPPSQGGLFEFTRPEAGGVCSGLLSQPSAVKKDLLRPSKLCDAHLGHVAKQFLKHKQGSWFLANEGRKPFLGGGGVSSCVMRQSKLQCLTFNQSCRPQLCDPAEAGREAQSCKIQSKARLGYMGHGNWKTHR